MRAFIFGILFTIVVIVAGGYVVLRNGLIPANADANPVELTDANLIAGIELYREHCAFCHGTAKGEASATSVAKGEYPQPPQLATDGVEDDPEGFSYWKIKHGIRWTGMPSWEGALTDQQIWTLALFLKHMDKLPPAAEQAWQAVHN